jgi:hypothetical protein
MRAALMAGAAWFQYHTFQVRVSDIRAEPQQTVWTLRLTGRTWFAYGPELSPDRISFSVMGQ